MKQLYTDRLQLLRHAMQHAALDVYLMDNSDPHGSEYLPDHWKLVEWLTGFRGEVARLVITSGEALLWTDSRFFISGAEQLAGTPFTLMRMKVDQERDGWLADYLAAHPGSHVGADLRVTQLPTLAEQGAPSPQDIDLIGPLWTDRPALPLAPIEVYPPFWAGEKADRRLERIRQAIAPARQLWLSALDDIAWALNLRGDDVACTPVFVAYARIGQHDATLYTDLRKVSPAVSGYLAELGVAVEPYETGSALASRVDADADYARHNPIPLMRAQKNDVELEGFRQAMVRDGVALTHFYRWLEGALADGQTVTEVQCQQRLIDLRRQQGLYRQESFPAIVAWNEHAAMPHYEPSPATDCAIAGNGLLLIDTGGQYLDGTTDITRTIGIGQPTAAMCRDYTLVLRGHIRLAQAVFPTGTRGDQLDALARMDLWREGKTFRHGTSHGVGHYLSVHEGPQSVRMEHNPQALLPGMVISNEPAIYLTGQYGIRHENCMAVRAFDVATMAPDSTPCDASEQGDFLCFETLTLCYLDTAPLVADLLTAEERAWVDAYNARVYDTLAPLLDAPTQAWLASKCQPIG